MSLARLVAGLVVRGLSLATFTRSRTGAPHQPTAPAAVCLEAQSSCLLRIMKRSSEKVALNTVRNGIWSCCLGLGEIREKERQSKLCRDGKKKVASV